MFQIDHMSRVPIYEQLVSQTERLILAGVLNANDKLESVRTLSVKLCCNPNTIQKAYTDLCNRGLIYSVPGKGCFVSGDAKSILEVYGRAKMSDFTELVNALKLSGVGKDELISKIENVYREGNNSD